MVTSSKHAEARAVSGGETQPISAAGWKWLNTVWSGSQPDGLIEPKHGWIPARLREKISHADEMLLDWARAPEEKGEDNSEHIRFALWLLRKADREARHRAIAVWPVRLGIEPLEWIALRPDTDIATVLELFWLLEPASYAKFIGEEENLLPHERRVLTLLTEIRLLLEAGYYHQGEKPDIGFAPPVDARTVDMRNDRNRALFPPQVFEPILADETASLLDRGGFSRLLGLFR